MGFVLEKPAESAAAPCCGTASGDGVTHACGLHRQGGGHRRRSLFGTRPPRAPRPHAAGPDVAFGSFEAPINGEERKASLSRFKNADAEMDEEAIAMVEHGERLAVSVDEVARLMGISRDLAYDLVARGELPSLRLGRRIVIPRVQLELVLRGEESAAASSDVELSLLEPTDRSRPPITSAASRSAASRKWA